MCTCLPIGICIVRLLDTVSPLEMLDLDCLNRYLPGVSNICSIVATLLHRSVGLLHRETYRSIRTTQGTARRGWQASPAWPGWNLCERYHKRDRTYAQIAPGRIVLDITSKLRKKQGKRIETFDTSMYGCI